MADDPREAAILRVNAARLKDPAWMARTIELGPVYLTWWLSGWAVKRRMVLDQLDLLDPLRMLVAKGVVLKAAPDSSATGQLLELIARHELLLDRCVAALQRGAVSGKDLVATLDEVFGDAELAARLGFELEPAQPDAADVVGSDLLHPDVEAILALVQAGELGTALQLAIDHVSAMEQEHGEQSLYAADALALVARVHGAKQQYPEAVQPLERALVLRAGLAGPTNPLTLRTVFDLAETYMLADRPDGAHDMLAPLARRLDERWQATHDPMLGIASCKVLYYLAYSHRLLGQAERAEDLAIECMHRINSNDAWDAAELQWLHESVAELLASVRGGSAD